MLLHDSYFHTLNKSLNRTHHGLVTIAYSPLFHSTLTLFISIFGLCFNLICCIKIWLIFYQYQKLKLKKSQRQQEQESQESTHILSYNKYRFLFILTSTDLLLCLSSIISCLDEKYFFQSFLARYHLCAAHVLIWKFTLHFIPLLMIFILCRYHFILNRGFQVKSSNLSAFNQLLCTDLSILIPFVLALAWSVDGLWLWGVANIKDYVMPPPSLVDESEYQNHSMEMATTSVLISKMNINTTLYNLDGPLMKSEEENDKNLYLPEQKTICHFQTNFNFDFTVRLVHLIQADFLLLFSVHLLSFVLEICLHIRLSCCLIIKKSTSTLNHERQLAIYILYTFIILTLTSLPFYSYRSIEILFDTQLISFNNDFINSRTFSQILLFGTCFKPLLFFILFFPSSILFKSKCHFKCYSPTNIQMIEQDEEMLPALSNHKNQIKPEEQKSITRSQHHRYSLLRRSTYYPRFHSKLRTRSNPTLTTNNYHQDSLSKSEQFNSWLKLTNSITSDHFDETSKIVYV